MRLDDLYPGAPHLRERLPERFWSKVDVRGENECWPWMFSVTVCPMGRGGYGRFGIGQGWAVAHRIAYMLAHGEVPDDRFVCHDCDNRRCCNPAHLWPGTGKDNSDDRDRKGRYVVGNRARGEQHFRAKFTADQVRDIRRRYKPRIVTRTALAREFGVEKSTIDRILDGVTWKEVA